MSFFNIPGNKSVHGQLQRSADSGNVSHAYIFCGQQGVFKHKTALEFARILTNNSTPDIIEVTNERYSVDKKVLSVDTIRAARQDMFTKPYMADKKVFIIDKAQEMNQECQNALLKVFEEPPSYCVIILITDNEQALLPTIRSRGVTVRFSPVEEAEIKAYLKEKGLEATDIILKLAGGSPQRAEELLLDPELVASAESFISLAKKLNSPTYGDLYTLISFFEKEKDNCNLYLDILLIIFRETLLKNVATCGTMALGDVSEGAAAKMTEAVQTAQIAIKSNGNYSTVISELFLIIPEVYND